MNKDVIYIEPEDDITDIITKIENAKQKIVALVPPKKAGVFRSIVNIKLIAKAGVNAEKAVVLVTTDPSIVKLAAATKMPVTKNLQSAPSVPSADDIEKIEAVAQTETIVDESGNEEKAEAEEAETLEEEAKPVKKETKKEPEEEKEPENEDKKADESQKEARKDDEAEDDEEKLEEDKKKDDKKSKKDKKPEKKVSSNLFVAWLQGHKILLIVGGVVLAALILILVWANVIAPAVTVNVSIRTTTANFSENVTFTEKLEEEKASEGKFYIEEKKNESKAEVDFEATGKKNVGKKASGEVVVYAYFRKDGVVPINAGSVFTSNDKSFVSTTDATLSWDGADVSACENNGSATAITSGCLISTRVPVEAEGSGSSYNLAANNNWSTTASVNVYSDSAISGGTDETITVVQQSDIDAAKEKIKSSNATENKEKLFESIDDDDFIIESSFKQTVGEGVSVPAVGEQVEEGKKAKLTVTTTNSVYVIDKTKMEEFIKEKAKLADGYKIYEMKEPFIENFTKTDAGYIGKLKTSYVSGPEVTAKDVVEIVKGKGLGTGRDDLTKAYTGISKVTTEVSFPWVTSFPNDENKITVNIEVEDTKDKTEEK
ncbi:hypothetical protein IKF12_02620 [Candidatus Saccharibacteria bacterium]|nr:hypothetical protein [Candidatus Saccharibacteria bacterium]